MKHEDTKGAKHTRRERALLGRDDCPPICRRCHFGSHRFFVRFAFFVSSCFIIGGAAPAQAQSFGPPVPTQTLLVLLDKSGHPRFTLEAYAAEWKNPFRVTVTVPSPALGYVPVSGKVSVIGETAASPLFEGTYSLGPHWAVGFWYNPIHDRAPQKFVQIADVALGVDLSRDADLGDLHVVYYAPRGLSAQLGYYRESGRVQIRRSDLQNPPTYTRFQQDYTHVSWNLWLTQRLDVRWRGRVVTPFVSFGYHPSSGLEHAASFLGGIGITLNERISLSGSLWLFDLSHPATRITGGVAYRL